MAYTQMATQLATAISTNSTVPAGTQPDDYSDKVVKSKVGPESETPPDKTEMGDVLADAAGPYTAGTDVVAVSFIGACPRNNLRLQGTFLEIQSVDTEGQLSTYATDGDVETRLHFETKKHGTNIASFLHTLWTACLTSPFICPHSLAGVLDFERYREVTVEWFIPDEAPAGTYRVVHYGTWYHEPIIGQGEYKDYVGYTGNFSVVVS